MSLAELVGFSVESENSVNTQIGIGKEKRTLKDSCVIDYNVGLDGTGDGIRLTDLNPSFSRVSGGGSKILKRSILETNSGGFDSNERERKVLRKSGVVGYEMSPGKTKLSLHDVLYGSSPSQQHDGSSKNVLMSVSDSSSRVNTPVKNLGKKTWNGSSVTQRVGLSATGEGNEIVNSDLATSLLKVFRSFDVDEGEEKVHNEMGSEEMEKNLRELFFGASQNQKRKGSSKKKFLFEEDPEWSPWRANVVRERRNPGRKCSDSKHSEGDKCVNDSMPVVQALLAVSENENQEENKTKGRSSKNGNSEENMTNSCKNGIQEDNKTKGRSCKNGNQEEDNRKMRSLVGFTGVYVSKPTAQIVQALPAAGGRLDRGAVKESQSCRQKHYLLGDDDENISESITQALGGDNQKHSVHGPDVGTVTGSIVQALPAPCSLKDFFSSAGWTVCSPKGASTTTYVSPSGCVYESPLKAFLCQASTSQGDKSDSSLSVDSSSQHVQIAVPEKSGADLMEDNKSQGVKKSVKHVPFSREFDKQIKNAEEVKHEDEEVLSKEPKTGEEFNEVSTSTLMGYKLKLCKEDELLDHEKYSSDCCSESEIMTRNEKTNSTRIRHNIELQGLRRSNRINGRHVPVGCPLYLELLVDDYEFGLSNFVDTPKPETLTQSPKSDEKEIDEEFSPLPGRKRFREVDEVMVSCVAKEKEELCNSTDELVQCLPPSKRIPDKENVKADLSKLILCSEEEVSTLEDETGNSCVEEACLSNETTESDRSSSILKDDENIETDMYHDGPLVGLRKSAHSKKRHIPLDGVTDTAAREVDDCILLSKFIIPRQLNENQVARSPQTDSFEIESRKTDDKLLKQISVRNLGSQNPGNQKRLECDHIPFEHTSAVQMFDGIRSAGRTKCSAVLKKNWGLPQKKAKCFASKKISVGCGGHSSSRRKRKRSGACRLMVRRTGKANHEKGILLEEKTSILSWLIDIGTVVEHESVVYNIKNGKGKMLKGRVTRGGIRCNCCRKILSMLDFEVHAGSDLHQPWNNTCLTSGKSLMQCQREAWEKEKKRKNIGFQTVGVGDIDPGDDTCATCADGGHVLCCDGCPSTFHPDCLKLKSLPEGNWYCPFCTCAFCMQVDCGQDKVNGTTNLLKCNQCGCKYHAECVCDDMEKMRSKSVTYCGESCEKVNSWIAQILGTTNSLGGNFTWTLLRRLDEGDGACSDRRLSQIIECNVKLSLALTVLYECFVPLIDSRTGLDMITQAVYSCGSNFKRLSYEGFFTAILEKDEEIISVATLRLHGTRIAEMPFIGTRPKYRRQGMCRRLLLAIEEVLSSLQVEKLIIPAIPDMLETWETSFSFKQIKESDYDQLRNLNMMIFHGTTLLQKPIYTRSAGTMCINGVDKIMDRCIFDVFEDVNMRLHKLRL